MIQRKTFKEITGITYDEAVDVVNSIKQYYYSFPIAKRNGKKRWIDAPNDELKSIQVNILHELLYQFRPHNCSFGFEKGKSVKAGAEQHQGAEVLLTMDINNFFNAFTTNSVQKGLHYYTKQVLSSFPIELAAYEEEVAVLTQLMVYMGCVPQGAPTSPALTNLLCYVLDDKLFQFAKRHDCVYTRYADDMSFSCKDKSFDMAIIKNYVSNNLPRLCLTNLTINTDKTRIQRKHKRMSVTGIVINDGLSVPRWKWRNFQAELYNLAKDKKEISVVKYQQLRGYIEWIRTLNPNRAQKFMHLLGKITVEP